MAINKLTLNLMTSIFFILGFACSSKGIEEQNYDIIKKSKVDEKSYKIWYFVSKVAKDRNYKVYVAKESIIENENLRRSWSKLVFDEDQKDPDGKTYKEVYILSSIDCLENTYSYLASRFYNSLGELVYSENIAPDVSPITPDTNSDYISKFVCADSEK
jgi:hypothetical protein